MKLTIHGLEHQISVAEELAQFGKPLSEANLEALKSDGFSSSRVRSAFCLGWLWLQWMSCGSHESIHQRVSSFVERGMTMQDKSALFYMRPQADLYLLHCAILGSSTSQLEKLATRVVDASGIPGHKPTDKGGDLYASAWCGMLKHWILGDLKKAEQQSDLIWNAYRDASFAATTKPLVTPWLKGDWKGFVKAQQKDFEKLWKRGRKDGTVRSENGEETVVTVQRYPIEQKWCWAHCGLALLARRQQGIEIATDPFWFPAHGVKCIDSLK